MMSRVYELQLVQSRHPVYESSEQIQYVDKAFEGPSLTPKGLEDEASCTFQPMPAVSSGS